MRAASHGELLRAFRDLTIVDRDNSSCGMVDDIEAEEVSPGIWELRALLIGPGVWRNRRPRWLMRLLPGKRVVRIDATDVASATSEVRLLRQAEELGLAKLECRLLAAWRDLPPIAH